jgi:hypothetical protein
VASISGGGLPVGGAVYGSRRGTFSIIYDCLPADKLKEHMMLLLDELFNAPSPADACITKIHIRHCQKALKEKLG